ncbi:hypothetical protein L1F30_11590 [Simiduia sp. 21SJ11W-1]|uniref:hypothetical protein n=1 Tax=Simiduia sp. 21SJ11W-1 TaxID=2909669 RepID=UPI00209DAFAB|nr:hypothetical protein [Simiduia sp. 21SJ11W-1]UTA46802.1 hypothetical protein L1F30_11590 [Simiduia sp. 21SJ11W-1]
MKSILAYVLIFFVSASAADEISVTLPESWVVQGSVIYKDNVKIGELISKDSWPYESGEDFIASFKNGFIDDPDTTKFHSSGKFNSIYWVCRVGAYEGANGETGIWYIRRFWVGGPILTLYSFSSCTDGFSEALEVASSVVESST